ncbi:MAG: winged helix-turn-helix transcriptional regulator [Deltaproteobacteria bacterium]|nr:winged helix-turn-helix transcriptional regulator [Deltaproteobacteria bacterium]
MLNSLTMERVNKRTIEDMQSIEKVIDLQVDLLKVIANKTRLKIMYLLKNSGEMHVSDLREILGVSKANLSQQISILKKAGIISTKTEGRAVVVIMEFKDLLNACDLVREFIREKLLRQAEPFLEG